MTWWPFRRRVDEVIDTLIRRPLPTFTGHDEAIEKETRVRRQQAERIRRTASALDTADRVPLRRVK